MSVEHDCNEPATVAAVVVMPEAAPVVTAVVLIPVPDAATFMASAPPPDTGMFPLYVCAATGVNFT